jgi:hypothetical protein
VLGRVLIEQEREGLFETEEELTNLTEVSAVRSAPSLVVGKQEILQGKRAT